MLEKEDALHEQRLHYEQQLRHLQPEMAKLKREYLVLRQYCRQLPGQWQLLAEDTSQQVENRALHPDVVMHDKYSGSHNDLGSGKLQNA